MPSRSSWKSRTSLLLSRLGSKRAAAAAAAGGGASLVVQAGFPTSLADLFVKNRSKILPKKPIKHKPVNPNPIPNPNPNLIPISPPVIAVRFPSRGNPNSRNPRGLGLGLGFVAVVLGVLAVAKKWVVIGITIVSLVLLVLESFGFLEKTKKKKKLEPLVRIVDLNGRGLVSPIREELSTSETANTGSNVSSEKSENSAKSLDFDENSTKKKKMKKLFRKLFKRKSNRKKDDGEENCLNEVQLIDEDGDDAEFLSFKDSDGVTDADSEEATSVVGNVDVNSLWIWGKFVFLVVTLFGLLGGKVVAVVLCMAWVLLSGCSGTVWRKSKME